MYSLVFLGLAIILLAFTHNARSRLWIALTVLVYLTTALWGLFWPVYSLHVNFALDAGMCLLVYKIGKERWEMEVWRFYQLMGMTNMFCVFGLIQGGTYANLFLEACNYAVLLVASTPALEKAFCRGVIDKHHNAWNLRWVVRSLRQKREGNPWFTKW